MKWYITNNRQIRNASGEANSHIITISENPNPPYKIVCRLDFGYGRKDDDEIAKRIIRSVNCHDDLLNALKELLSVQPTESPIYDSHSWDLAIDFAKSVVAKTKGEV